MDISRDENKRLCDRYPFLIPWNRWSGKLITEADNGGYWPGEPDKVPEYDYEYTELDDLPDGWRIAFGEQMCEELRNELIRNGDLDRWRITELKEKYGCYDEETEVLTRRGWKYFKNVTYDDEFATLDADGETLIYQRPTDIIKEQYTGQMYHLENRGVNFLVTTNHNMYVSKGSYYYHEKNNQKITYPFELVAPDKYFGRDKRFKKGATWVGNNPYGGAFHIDGYNLTNEMSVNHCKRTYHHDGIDVDLISWLKFLGFYVAEGYTSNSTKKYGTEIAIAYNPEDEEELVCELLRGIGVEARQSGNTKRFYNSVIGRWLLDNCGHLAINKKVPEFIKELTPDMIEIFLQYLYIGDGHKNPTSHILTTASKQLCDDVCELLIKAGYSFRYRIRPTRSHNNPNHKIQVTGKYQTYEINWLKNTYVEIDNSKHADDFVERYEPYNGMVYCVTVPSHVLYVRRGGKGAWCGNSMRLYDNGYKKGSCVPDIIDKYTEISRRTCIVCGKPATRITLGWISPFCDECCVNCGNGKSMPIDEFYREDHEDG